VSYFRTVTYEISATCAPEAEVEWAIHGPEVEEPNVRVAHVGDVTTEAEATTRWNFYSSDDDRSNGWTNHGLSLQFVCEGYGATADEAWAEAKTAGRVPALMGELNMDDSPVLVGAELAIRVDHELRGGWAA
jgi:hypothetical protein